MNAVAVLLGYAGTRNAIEQVLNGGNVFRTLRRLTERHLLTARDGEAGREYLQHAIVQTFYYEQTSLRERRSMQRRAGAYYEQEEIDLLRAGIYFERAGEYVRAAGIATKDIWAIINRGEARVLRLLLERFPYGSFDLVLWIDVLIASGQVYHFISERERAKSSYVLALEQLTKMVNTPEVAVRHSRACRGLGELLQLENPQEALHWFERGLATVTTDAPLEEAALRIQMGITHVLVGDYEVARNALELGLQVLGNQPSQLRSSALACRGAIELYQGNIAQALIFTESALKISQQLNDAIRIVNYLTDLSIEKYSLGNWTDAIFDFQRALTVARQLGSEQLQATVEVNLGAAYINLGEDEAAQQHLQSSLTLAHKNHLHAIEVIAQLRLADLQIRIARWQQAESAAHAAEELARQIGDNSSLIAIYRVYAEFKQATGDITGALLTIEHSITLAEELQERLEQGQSLRILGQICLKQGDYQQAVTIFEKSLSLLVDNEPYEAARTKVNWGIALVTHGDKNAGICLLQEAQHTFNTFGAKRDLIQVDVILSAQDGRVTP